MASSNTRRLPRSEQGSSRALDLFPDLRVWPTVKTIYQALTIHWWHIFRLTLPLMLLSLIAYVGGDVLMSWRGVSFQNFWVISFVVQVFEVLLFYFFSLSVYRLMLLGGVEAVFLFDRSWRRRFVRYALRSITLFIPMVITLVLCYAFLYGFAAIQPQYVFFAVPIILIICYWVFLRFSFALPGAAVDAPYSIIDSWRATNGVAIRVLLIGLFTVGPFVVLLAGTVFLVERSQPLIDLVISDSVSYELNVVYWLLAPLGIFFSYLLAALVVISTAVMFYVRTGWRPGSVRADL